MIIQRTKDTFCGYYDFNVTGGAVGAYDLQIPVYQNAIIYIYGVVVTAPLTSATSLATISFDVIDTSVSPQVTFTGALYGAAGITTFYNTGQYASYGIAPGSSTAGIIGIGEKFGNAFSVGMSIGTEPLLSGAIQIFMECILLDF